MRAGRSGDDSGGAACLAEDRPEARWTALQCRTLLLCVLLNMLDGGDVLVVSYAAPLLTREWGLSAQALGVVFSAGLVGMAVGALLIAPLADVLGRRILVLLSLAILLAGMLVSARVSTVAELAGLRFLTGLGIGSMLASITALASEFAPPRSRSFAVSLVTAGYPLGAAATGLAAQVILPAYGWRGLFVAAGLISGIMLPVCWRWLPESRQFLLAHKRPDGSTARARDRSLRPPVGQLVSVELRTRTLLTWGAFFGSFMTLYFLTSWLPRIAVDAGLSLAAAVHAGTLFNLGAFLGLLLLGRLSSRLDLRRMIGWFFAGAALVMIVFGAVHTPIALFYGEIFLIGVGVQGGFGGLYAVATQIYPTAVRATGVGWALGVGRLGAIAGPMLGGVLIDWGVGLFGSFVAFAVPIAIAAVLMRVHAGDVRAAPDR